jgi:hypothetical protein
MPMIHNGDRTHHHDQVITPVSLSTISVITAIWTAAAGTDSLRHRTLGRGRSIRISDTLPAYGAGIEERYGGMSANLDQGLGGLLAYYSIIHIARERRPEIFAEFHRVLTPGGILMLVFQIGDEQGHRTDFRGMPVSVDWYRQRPDELANLLHEAGFELWTTAVRQPEGSERVAQGYILVRKPQP